jgi:hypothetical protein
MPVEDSESVDEHVADLERPARHQLLAKLQSQLSKIMERAAERVKITPKQRGARVSVARSF